VQQAQELLHDPGIHPSVSAAWARAAHHPSSKALSRSYSAQLSKTATFLPLRLTATGSDLTSSRNSIKLFFNSVALAVFHSFDRQGCRCFAGEGLCLRQKSRIFFRQDSGITSVADPDANPSKSRLSI
jgi:hypothetical protein